MFKRTVSFLFVIALLAGLFAGGAGATMYYYNIPDVRNLPKAECEKALKAKKYITEIIWVEVEAPIAHADRKVPGNGTLRDRHRRRNPRISRSR